MTDRETAPRKDTGARGRTPRARGTRRAPRGKHLTGPPRRRARGRADRGAGVRRGPAVAVVARGAGGGVRGPARRPQADPTASPPGGARRRVLPAGAGAPRGAVGGDRPHRSALPRSPPSVCRRPRPLRRRLAVRVALRGADDIGEETLAAWLLAPSGPAAVRGGRRPCRRWRRVSTCGRTWLPSARRWRRRSGPAPSPPWRRRTSARRAHGFAWARRLFPR